MATAHGTGVIRGMTEARGTTIETRGTMEVRGIGIHGIGIRGIGTTGTTGHTGITTITTIIITITRTITGTIRVPPTLLTRECR